MCMLHGKNAPCRKATLPRGMRRHVLFILPPLRHHPDDASSNCAKDYFLVIYTEKPIFHLCLNGSLSVHVLLSGRHSVFCCRPEHGTILAHN